MHSNFNFSQQKVVVTGGAGEIGFSIARAFHACGADVAIIDIDSAVARKADELNSGAQPGRAYAVKADLSDRNAVRKAFATCMEQLGTVDVFVNAAGMIRREDAEHFPVEDWDSILEVNLTATFLFCQLAAQEMLRHGRGRIINIGSMNSFDGGHRICAYAASKGAVALVTKSFSNEWSKKGITVNAIAPGYIATQINRFYRTPAGEEQNRAITARIPMGRWGTPDDICGAALFFASTAAEYISGVVLPVDGGYQAF